MVTPTTLIASPGTSRVYRFDFANYAEMQAGTAITGAAVSADDALTVGTPDVDDTFVDVRIAVPSDAAEATYEVACAASTDGGDTLAMLGLLRVGGGVTVVTAPAVLLETGGLLLLD